MNKLSKFSLAAWLLAATVGGAFADSDTHSGRAVNESAQTSSHASASAAHSIAASGQVTSAALAVPLSVGATVLISGGAVSAGVAHDSMRAATAPIGTPLQVTDETITVIPPNQALKTESKTVVTSQTLKTESKTVTSQTKSKTVTP